MFLYKKRYSFKPFIVVSSDTTEDKINEITYCIEDVTITNIESGLVFISITLFLEYINNDTKAWRFSEDKK